MSAAASGSWSWPGALVGFLISLGVWLVIARLPRARQIRLDDRLEPYLRDTTPPSRLLDRQAPAYTGWADVLHRLIAPWTADLGRLVERILGGGASVRRRQLRAGYAADVEGFRAEQVLWGFGGAVVGAAIGVVNLLSERRSLLTLVVLILCGAACGVVLRDHLLTRAANARELRMLREFPTVAELLALAVAAGEGAAGALERVCRLSRGELSRELSLCLADARAGASLPTALEGLADRTGLVSLARFVDGMVIAVQRGTPLAEVLRAQAQDVREQGRRAVMETGGRKEIAMMVPVVFLVLPVTVLFALFPGIALLNITF